MVERIARVVRIRTTRDGGGRACGIVTGMGATPQLALAELRREAEGLAQQAGQEAKEAAEKAAQEAAEKAAQEAAEKAAQEAAGKAAQEAGGKARRRSQALQAGGPPVSAWRGA